MKRLALLATLLLVAAAVPAAATAHIQVSPTLAAPADPTLFTFLVPNESDNPTVQIDLKIPVGVVPFSFEETPGWERSEERKANGALDVVTWKGSIPPGAFVRFSFLASTPDTPGQVTWPAVQRYEDGSVVRWIGPPHSEEPAAVTAISADVPRQNAGGESASASDSTGEAAQEAPTETAAVASQESGDDGGTSALSIVALIVGAAGLLVGVAALLVVRRRRV